MDKYLLIFSNNLTPFFANIGLLILTAWLISYFYQKNNRSILTINFQDKIILGFLLGFITYLLINSPVKLESGIIMDTRGVPLLVSGMLGGPISGVITMLIGLYVRYSFGGAGMIGGLIYIVIFSLSGIIWYKLNHINKFPSPKKLTYLIIGITALTMPVIFTLPENKQLWALITIWPLMYIANGFGAYVIANVIKHKIEEINLNFMQKETIKKQQEELTQKDIQILEQSKMIALGEMLGNIAHQWRQPLSVITIASTSLKFKQSNNQQVSPEDIIKASDLINQQAQYLSTTIDNFINFTKKNKEKKELTLQDEIFQAKQILEASLKNNFITLTDKVNYETSVNIIGVKGELSQIFINILNNAKDIIKEKNIENGLIKIDLTQSISNVIITIEDNAGGICDSIINKVFEPYFTTKHKSQGTGLGLHICYQIITQSYNGTIWVENSDMGAKFFIKLPLN